MKLLYGRCRLVSHVVAVGCIDGCTSTSTQHDCRLRLFGSDRRVNAIRLSEFKFDTTSQRYHFRYVGSNGDEEMAQRRRHHHTHKLPHSLPPSDG